MALREGVAALLPLLYRHRDHSHAVQPYLARRLCCCWPAEPEEEEGDEHRTSWGVKACGSLAG